MITVFNRVKYMKSWRNANKEYIKQCSKSYYDNHRKQCMDRNRVFIDKNPNYFKKYSVQYYRNNRDLISLKNKSEKRKIQQQSASAKYKKTENGKLSVIKSKTKRNRKLGFHVLYSNPFNESEKIEWHHINDNDVVAIPKDLHRIYCDKYHRDNIMEIVKQIYLGMC